MRYKYNDSFHKAHMTSSIILSYTCRGITDRLQSAMLHFFCIRFLPFISRLGLLYLSLMLEALVTVFKVYLEDATNCIDNIFEPSSILT